MPAAVEDGDPRLPLLATECQRDSIGRDWSGRISPFCLQCSVSLRHDRDLNLTIASMAGNECDQSKSVTAVAIRSAEWLSCRRLQTFHSSETVT
jgi:hypothetical protein